MDDSTALLSSNDKKLFVVLMKDRGDAGNLSEILTTMLGLWALCLPKGTEKATFCSGKSSKNEENY